MKLISLNMGLIQLNNEQVPDSVEQRSDLQQNNNKQRTFLYQFELYIFLIELTSLRLHKKIEQRKKINTWEIVEGIDKDLTYRIINHLFGSHDTRLYALWKFCETGP